eukprot:SAG11_NODE_13_length_26388_cov_67.360341_30_plen_721_part_00
MTAAGLLLLLLAKVGAAAAAPAAAHALPSPTPAELVKSMAVGINLGNTLDATTEGAWENVAREELFDAYKAFPADDKYIAHEVHACDPYLYEQCKQCGQGACPSPKCATESAPGPGCCATGWGAAGQASTDRWIGGMQAWAAKRKISLVYGEFGVTHVQMAATGRVQWYAYHRKKALAAGMAVLVWDDNGGFCVLNRSAAPLSSGWGQPVPMALIPSSLALKTTDNESRTMTERTDEAMTLFVDPRSGDDSAVGSSLATPLRSLRAAQTAARELRSRHTHAHVTVRLLPGTHHVGKNPLFLGPEDAGVTWRSHDASLPASVGAPIRVTGWKAKTINGKPGAVASLPSNISKGTKLRHLWVNSKRAARPTGYPAAEGVCAAPYNPAVTRCTFNLTLTANTTTYPEGSAYDFSLTTLDPSSWRNPEDVEFVFTSCAGFNCWVEPRCGVSSVEGSVVTLSGGSVSSCYHKLYYYGIGWGGPPAGRGPRAPTSIENLWSNFSHPGEFYYDRSAGTISYIMREGETLSDLEATATTATTQSILIVNATHDVAWRDVSFEYATWLGASSESGFVDTQSAFIYGGGHNEAWGGDPTGGEPPVNIHVFKSSTVSFSGCRFEHLGAVYAIGGDGGSQELVVFNSSFRDISGGGIKLGYSGERSFTPAPNAMLDPSLQDRGFLISDNLFEGIPCEYSGANPIFAAYVADSTLAHNTIRDSRYSAICAGWG